MKYLVAIGIVLVFLFAGCLGAGAQAPQQGAEDTAMAEKKAMEEKQAMMDKNKTNESVMEKKEESGAMMKSAASYTDYDAAAYQTAKSEGKIIYLEFYASWCPTCRAYEPKLLSAFETMAADAKYKDVVGFKVNYDTQNDLKQMFGIVGQHTHVILGKNGNVVVQSREEWSSQDLMENIGKAL